MIWYRGWEATSIIMIYLFLVNVDCERQTQDRCYFCRRDHRTNCCVIVEDVVLVAEEYSVATYQVASSLSTAG